jgi:hypothetical protein
VLPHTLEDEATIGFSRSGAHEIGEGSEEARNGSMTDDARRRSRLIDEAPFAVAIDDAPRSLTLLDEV